MNKRIFVLAMLAMTAVACSDDDGDDDSGVQIKTDASTQPPIDAGAGSIDSGINQADAAVADTGVSAPVVKGAPGCFSGVAATNEQLLNACAPGFQVFDNSRLPGFVNGVLPPIPQ